MGPRRKNRAQETHTAFNDRLEVLEVSIGYIPIYLLTYVLGCCNNTASHYICLASSNLTPTFDQILLSDTGL